MTAILEDGKLRLSGYVGDYYHEDGFTSSDVVLALAQVADGADLVVHVNSGGGVASEGAAIHALLKARSGTTDVVVEGIAASAASLIAMAGVTVTMSAGAVMMIHDPSGFTFGTSDAHSKTIEGLEALATAYARVYADKSGKTAAECRTIMKAERWYTPEEAVAEGFADATTEVKGEPVAAFDYRRYAHAPKALTQLAMRMNWSLSAAENRAAASAPANRQAQETLMSDKERADQLAAENDRLKASAVTAALEAVNADRARRAAIMALPEAEGRSALAEHLYAKGESVDDAKATLAASPKASAAAEIDLAKEHENRRLNGEGLNVNGGKPTAKGDRSILAAAVARTNKRR